MDNLDIRLLTVFDAIQNTRSVTRAADLLGIGQPAASIALAKLRDHFADPLFVRTAAGMAPTPLVQSLRAPVREALDALERVREHRSTFDPSVSDRTFRVCMTDISQLVLLPALWARLRVAAPGIRIEIAPLLPDTGPRLEDGSADLALGFMPQLEAGYYQQALFRQDYVCMVSADHPRIGDDLTLAGFEAADHAVITSSGTGHQIVDREIARRGITRRIALHIPNFIGAAFVIERTDLLVTIPRRLGEVLEGRGRFRVLPVPFALPDYTVKQHWHERFHRDPGNRWLRSVISELLSAPAKGRPDRTG